MTQFVDEKTNSDKELEIALILFLVIATGVRAGSTIGKQQEEGVGSAHSKEKIYVSMATSYNCNSKERGESYQWNLLNH